MPYYYFNKWEPDSQTEVRQFLEPRLLSYPRDLTSCDKIFFMKGHWTKGTSSGDSYISINVKNFQKYLGLFFFIQMGFHPHNLKIPKQGFIQKVGYKTSGAGVHVIILKCCFGSPFPGCSTGWYSCVNTYCYWLSSWAVVMGHSRLHVFYPARCSQLKEKNQVFLRQYHWQSRRNC